MRNVNRSWKHSNYRLYCLVGKAFVLWYKKLKETGSNPVTAIHIFPVISCSLFSFISGLFTFIIIIHLYDDWLTDWSLFVQHKSIKLDLKYQKAQRVQDLQSMRYFCMAYRVIIGNPCSWYFIKLFLCGMAKMCTTVFCFRHLLIPHVIDYKYLEALDARHWHSGPYMYTIFSDRNHTYIMYISILKGSS